MAYGGPDEIKDVKPYLMSIRGGRPTPDELVREVESRYQQIGGQSPLKSHTQAQAQALEAELRNESLPFTVAIGMRHWKPWIHQVVEDFCRSGIKKAVGLVMAPHFSRLSVGAYFDRLSEALERFEAPPQMALIRSWKEDPGYLDTLEANIRHGLARFPADERPQVRLVFTAHSLPERILSWDDPYPRELRATYRALTRRFPGQPAVFAYQSAAMTPEPWLGPDAGELMEQKIDAGERSFLVAPIGFVSEHVEILYDIDIDFTRRVEAKGGRLERIAMPNADPRMMSSLAQQVRAKAEEAGWL
jgi:ferrochelatase